MTTAGKDERRARRYNVKHFELFCAKGNVLSILFGGSKGDRLPVINFSVGGAQFLADHNFRKGDRLHVSLRTPGSSEPLSLDAQVCWSQQVPRRSAYRIGVQFQARHPASAQRLHEIEASITSLTVRMICAHCKSALVISKKLEGSTAHCPKCKQPLQVLDEEFLPDLPSEKHAQDASGGPGGSDQGRPTTLRPQFVQFLRTTLKSRLHLDIVQRFTRGERGQVAGSRELAQQVNESERKVYEVLRELVGRGVLKEIGVKTFNYDPIPATRQYIAELATALASPVKRSEVLAIVLGAERPGGS